ncbi:hypothetical protein G0Q01_06405, partial [Yangia sp. PrR007]|nr:hypothetical protein [Salipiger sp. PrR007]
VKARSERLEWQEDEILVLADGFTRKTASELETLDLPGVVVTTEDEDEGNVYRLGRYHLATALNRPATYTLQVGWEHLRVTRGDKVRFVHDVPLIGVGQARIKAITVGGDGFVDSLVLDDVFDMEQASFRMLVRNVGGNQSFTAFSPVDPQTRVWTPATNVAAGDIAVGDLAIVEELMQESVDLIVTSVRPKPDESAELQLVDAVPAVLDADSGAIPPYSPVITEPRDPATAGLPPAPVVISAYSSSLTQIVLPDLSVRPRIAVQLAPFVTGSAAEGVTLQLRWSDAEAEAAWVYGEKVAAGEYTLLTGALEEGESYRVEVSAVGADGKTRGWVSAGSPLVASLTPPPPPAITLTVTPATVADASGAGRRPAIRIAWSVLGNTTLRVTWQLRVKATGAVMQTGLFAESSDGYLTISEAILPNVEYQVRASFVTGAPALRTWSAWFSVTSDDLRISAADIADDLRDRIDTAFERHDQALEDVESGTIRELLDAIEGSLGSLDNETSLQDQIGVERDRLDVQIPRIYEAEEAQDDILQSLMDLSEAQFATDTVIRDAGIYVSPEDGTVKITAVEYLENRYSDVQFNLDAVESELSLRATVAYVNQALAEAVLDPSQIPLLDDITLRLSNAEATISAEEAQVQLLTDTLTVEGGLVTMNTVTAELDSLNNALELRVTSADFDVVEARLSAAEVTLTALPDNAAITESVEASRIIGNDLADGQQLSIVEAWARFTGDEAIRTAEAQAREDLRSYINENDEAISERVTLLDVEVADSRAQIEQRLTTQASETEALSESLTQTQVDLADAETGLAATVETLEETRGRVEKTEAGLAAASESRTFLLASVRQGEEMEEAQLAAAWDAFSELEAVKAGVAVALREQKASVTEGLEAEASERLLLGAALIDARAAIEDESRVRVTADDALASRAAVIEATLNTPGGVLARISTIEGAYVDADGAVAAVEQKISAEYGDLEALAEATAFAKAGLDGIVSGFVWRLNDQDVMEMVSVSEGTDGATVTYRLAADYVHITGLTQIDDAVLISLAAAEAFIGALEVDTLNIKQGAVVVPSHVQSAAVEALPTTWQTIAVLNFARTAGVRTQIEFGGQMAGVPPFAVYGDGASAEFRVVRSGSVFAGNLFHTSGFKGARNSYSFTVEDTNTAGGTVTYSVQAKNYPHNRHDKTAQIIYPWLRATQYKR